MGYSYGHKHINGLDSYDRVKYLLAIIHCARGHSNLTPCLGFPPSPTRTCPTLGIHFQGLGVLDSGSFISCKATLQN